MSEGLRPKWTHDGLSDVISEALASSPAKTGRGEHVADAVLASDWFTGLCARLWAEGAEANGARPAGGWGPLTNPYRGTE